jgi:hypothetical protein
MALANAVDFILAEANVAQQGIVHVAELAMQRAVRDAFAQAREDTREKGARGARFGAHQGSVEQGRFHDNCPRPANRVR